MSPRRPAFLVDAAGHRHAIAERFLVGRSRELDLTIPSGRVSKHHLGLRRLVSDELEAEDFGTTNGTLINGERLTHRVLTPGDVLEVDGHRFTFEGGARPDLPVDPAADLVNRAPDDGALQVAIDALLERGDPLGEQLAAGAPWPLPKALEDAVRAGELSVERRRGAPFAVRLRADPSFNTQRDRLFALLRTEASRLLASLALPNYSPRLGLEGARVPSLRRLRFGPFFSRELSESCQQALAKTRFEGLPWLEQVEVETWARAWLDFGADQRRELVPGRQESFTSFVVRWENGAWRVERAIDRQHLWVNGVSRWSSVLVPGDAVRAGNLAFTFRAA